MNSITEEKQELNLLNNEEIDTIGEILNISMGSAATSLSMLLSNQVDITTPNVKVIKAKDFEFINLEPAIGIEISYIEGLSGSNFLIMKKSDIRAIVELLIGGDDSDDGSDKNDDDDLDEMHLSAIGEIMNQMMGASCTALAQFFGKNINISTPVQFSPKNINEKINISSIEDYIVTVSFDFKVEGLVNSEFITILPISFTKEIVMNVLDSCKPEEKAQAKPDMQETTNNKNKDKKPVVDKVEYKMVNESFTEKDENKHKMVNVQPLTFKSFDNDLQTHNNENQVNYSLVMGVELEITVEIGRTKKPVKDILELRAGSVIELDKQAGDPVDVIVNGQLIARGDVVVIEDNFGVRITEIIQNKGKY
ncbi:MAG: CheC, inhibitor of methylation / FliN fusion protein [Clostridia bacterium]|nr:CheC, inhibitor of methylation / FliN fusion protein [Clostridia bacterium]